MNKKMRELKAKMKLKLDAVKALDSETEAEAIAGLLDEMDELEKAYELEARVYAQEKGLAEEHFEDPSPDGAAKETGFGALAKLFRGQELSKNELEMITPSDEVQKALITGTDAANGENYLIPEDVRTQINELRRSYVSAKELVTVIPTDSLTGSFVFESGAPAGLTSFDDGDDVPTGGEPEFIKKPWTIGFYGKIIPVSNILTLAERAGLMAYLDKWFLKNAIITENAKIFAALISGKTPVSLDGWEALKEKINVDLDPSCKLTGLVATNQSGFNYLDKQKDENGRPILQPNPANSTEKLFQDMPVKIYPNTQLADVASGKHPVFYGNTADGCWFIEFLSLLMASSSHSGFRKNQTDLRVLEGFAVMSADAGAYGYGLLEETAEPVTP